MSERREDTPPSREIPAVVEFFAEMRAAIREQGLTRDQVMHRVRHMLVRATNFSAPAAHTITFADALCTGTLSAVQVYAAVATLEQLTLIAEAIGLEMHLTLQKRT